MALALQRLAYEISRVRDDAASEREKTALRLENQLLRFERRLPGGNPGAEQETE
ncbi:MAG: hypothetical protein JO250_15970 [Armatimonadetes bacterium]|nr:hypothetical protein [Armatimonadota bacterium]